MTPRAAFTAHGLDPLAPGAADRVRRSAVAPALVTALDAWAAKLRGWLAQGQDVFVYCDNDIKVRAPYDAMGLLNRVRPLSS